METDISISILTGGLSKRFGKDKMLEPLIAGKRMPCYIKDKIKEFSDDIFTVGKKVCSVKNYSDLIDLKSPLSGIYTSLKEAKYNKILIIGGDLPFIKKELIEYIIKESEKDEFEVIVPVIRGYFEPLISVYKKSLINRIEEMIKKRDYKVNNLIESSKFLAIEEEKIKFFDKELISFLNINTEEELKKGLTLIKT